MYTIFGLKALWSVFCVVLCLKINGSRQIEQVTFKIPITLTLLGRLMCQGSRVRPIWLHVHPNFSRVRLTKIPGRTGASSHSRKEKVSATQKLCGSTKDTPVRLTSWSKPIRDSEGRTPPSDWPWSRYSCMCVCALTNASRVLLQSDREKEVSSRDACSVANLATFSAFVDPHSNFLFSKKSN